MREIEGGRGREEKREGGRDGREGRRRGEKERRGRRERLLISLFLQKILDSLQS